MKFLVARKRLYLAAMMLSLLVGLMACSPRRVVLKTIPAEAIPEEFRSAIEARLQSYGSQAKPLVSDLVWRVYEVREGRLLVAFTFTRSWKTGEGAETMYDIHVYDLDKDGQKTGSVWGGRGDLESFVLFRGGYGSGAVRGDVGEELHSLFASGYCLDGRVKAIQGTTTGGQIVKAKPSGGFWYLQLDNTDSTEDWARISAVDKNGEPVADLTIYPRQPR